MKLVYIKGNEHMTDKSTNENRKNNPGKAEAYLENIVISALEISDDEFQIMIGRDL